MSIRSTRRSKPQDAREGGFTLVELLVVVAIVGILSAIAIHQFVVYKKQAVDAEMQTDLHSARTAMENFYEQNNYSYVGADVAILKSNHGFQETMGVSLSILSTSASDYSLRTCAANGNYLSWRFDSDGGTMVGENVNC